MWPPLQVFQTNLSRMFWMTSLERSLNMFPYISLSVHTIKTSWENTINILNNESKNVTEVGHVRNFRSSLVPCEVCVGQWSGVWITFCAHLLLARRAWRFESRWRTIVSLRCWGRAWRQRACWCWGTTRKLSSWRWPPFTNLYSPAHYTGKLEKSSSFQMAKNARFYKNAVFSLMFSLLCSSRGGSCRLQQEYSCFGAVCRLAKRWLAAQLFSDDITEDTADLLVASLFLQPAPFTPPG